jgi:hypothetical protein
MSLLDTSHLEDQQIDAAKSSTKSTKSKSSAKKKSTATKKTTRRSSSKRYTKTGIPGLSVRFNWKEFLGINKLRRKFTKQTGIPTTQAGIERKMGRKLWDWIKGLFGQKES